MACLFFICFCELDYTLSELFFANRKVFISYLAQNLFRFIVKQIVYIIKANNRASPNKGSFVREALLSFILKPYRREKD